MSLILSGTDGLSDVDGTAATPAIRGTDANTGIFFPAADTIAFSEGGAEAARIDSSGNFGLGVTPSAWDTTTTSRGINFGRGGAVFYSTNDAQSSFGVNFYQSASNTYNYINSFSSPAGRYSISDFNGNHVWSIAPAGTAGNPISFTQAMTLTAASNLGVGTTSPSFKLDVQSATAAQANFQQTNANSYGEIRVTGSSRGGQIEFMNGAARLAGMYADTSNNLIFVNGTGDTERARIDSSGNLGLGVTPSAWSWRALQVGSFGGFFATNSAAYASYLGNNAYYDGSNWRYIASTGAVHYELAGGDRAHRWYNAPLGTAGNAITFTQAMTLDASGNLLVGTTSTLGGKLSVSTSNVAWAGWFQQTQGAGNSVILAEYSAAAPNSATDYFGLFRDNAAQRIQLRSNGGIGNYSANNVNLSDRREKTNFAPAGSYLDKICAIPVQTFNYIDQNMEDDGGLTLGVVAQDVQAVAPEMVMESNWAKDGDEPKMRLSIYQTDLQYALMKCIQEQQAFITQLTARITALEGA